MATRHRTKTGVAANDPRAGSITSIRTFGTTRRSGRWTVLVPVHVFKGNVVPGQRFYAQAPGWVRSSCDIVVAKRDLVLVYQRAGLPISLRRCSSSGLLKWSFDQLPFLFGQSPGR